MNQIINHKEKSLAPSDAKNRALVVGVNWGEQSAQIFPMNTKEAMQSATPSMASIRRYSGTPAAFATVGAMIGEVCRFLNVGKTMNQAQVPMTVQLIMKDYYFLKVADIKLAFMNGLSGKYGKAFDRLDGQMLLLWLAEYCEERATIAETKSINSHEAVKVEKWSQEAKEKFKAIHASWAGKQKKASKEKRFWISNMKYESAGMSKEQFETIGALFLKEANNTTFDEQLISACSIGGQDPTEFFIWCKISQLRNYFNKQGGFDIEAYILELEKTNEDERE